MGDTSHPAETGSGGPGDVHSDDELWRHEWMRGEAAAVYPSLAGQALRMLTFNVSDEMLAAALHAFPPEKGIYVQGHQVTPEAQRTVDVVARASTILEGLFPLNHAYMHAVIERAIGKDEARRLNQQPTGDNFYDRSRRFTYFEAPAMVTREGLITALHTPFNLIAAAASMAPAGLPPIAESPTDLIRVLRAPWFVRVVETAARTGNGFWRALSTHYIFSGHVMSDLSSRPSDPRALSFAYSVDEHGHSTFTFTPEAELVLHAHRRTRNMEAYKAGNVRGTSSGCPAARLQAHFRNEEEANAAAWVLNSTVEAVQARAERTGIHECLLIIANLLDRAAILEQTGA